MGVEAFFVFHALISDLQFSPNSKHLNATDSARLQRGAAAFGFFKKDGGGIKKSCIKPKAEGKSGRLFQVC